MSVPRFTPETIRQQLIATGNANPFEGAYSGDLMLAAEQRIGDLETDIAIATRSLERLSDTLAEVCEALVEARTGYQTVGDRL
jgi:uncharacterized coiled-coil protein SlyX